MTILYSPSLCCCCCPRSPSVALLNSKGSPPCEVTILYSPSLCCSCCSQVTPAALLNGEVSPPREATILYNLLLTFADRINNEPDSSAPAS